MNIDSFIQTLKKISCHSRTFACTMENLMIRNEKKMGLNSKICFICNMCNEEFVIETVPENSSKLTINYLAVTGVIGVGIGRAGLEELLGVLDIPCMSRSTYAFHQKKAEVDMSVACMAEMKNAAMEAKEIAINKGDIDSDGVPLLTVSADACFSKRTYGTGSSYSSLSGAGSIVAHDTGKII